MFCLNCSIGNHSMRLIPALNPNAWWCVLSCRSWSTWSWRRLMASYLWWQLRRAAWSMCRTRWPPCWTSHSPSGLAAPCTSRSILTMWTNSASSSAPLRTPWPVRHFKSTSKRHMSLLNIESFGGTKLGLVVPQTSALHLLPRCQVQDRKKRYYC